MATADDVIAAIPEAERKNYADFYAKPEDGDKAKIKERIEKRDAAVAGLEAAYRAFFASNGVSAVVIPAFANEPTKIGIEGEKGKCFMNEVSESMSESVQCVRADVIHRTAP